MIRRANKILIPVLYMLIGAFMMVIALDIGVNMGMPPIGIDDYVKSLYMNEINSNQRKFILFLCEKLKRSGRKLDNGEIK